MTAKSHSIGIIPENQIVTAPNFSNITAHYRSNPIVYHVIDNVTVGHLSPLFQNQTRTDIVFSCAVSQAGGIYSSYGPGCYWPTNNHPNFKFVFNK